jgi:hypothetical protein
MAASLARDSEELKLIEAKERQMQGKIASLVKYEGVSFLGSLSHSSLARLVAWAYCARRPPAELPLPPSHTHTQQELATCIKLLEEWDVDVAKLAEGTSRHQRHLEKHEALLAEQQDFENQINVSLASCFFRFLGSSR